MCRSKYIYLNNYHCTKFVCTYFFLTLNDFCFQITEDVILGKCPPIYHRTEPMAEDSNADSDTENKQAAFGE